MEAVDEVLKLLGAVSVLRLLVLYLLWELIKEVSAYLVCSTPMMARVLLRHGCCLC